VHLTADFDDRRVDVIGEHYDLVIRIADMPDSTLIARKLTETRHVFCASAAYLDIRAPIRSMDDLQSQRILHVGRARRFTWTARGPDGRSHSVTLSSALTSSDGKYLLSAAAAGAGIVRLPDFLAQPALSDGRLIQVLPDFRPDALGVYCVHAPTRFLPGRVRAMKDHLVQSLGSAIG